MALNWNQEISVDTLKDLFKRGKGASSLVSGGYPSKTTMNLFQGEKRTVNLRTVLIMAIVVVVGMSAFLKFGVFDQLSALAAKQQELSEQQILVSNASASSADYATLKEAYDAYKATYGGVSVDAIQVLDLVEQHVKNVANVTNIVLSDGTLTLTLTGVPLNLVGDLAKDLENQPLVSAVNVSTATTQQNTEGQNTTATLVVTLVKLSAGE